MNHVARIDVSEVFLGNKPVDLTDESFDTTRSEALIDLTAVGVEKPIGFEPLTSLGELLGVDVERLRDLLHSAGITTAVLGNEYVQWLYAYDSKALEALLTENRKIVVDYGWTVEPDKFVANIANVDVPISEELFLVIAKAFGDEFSIQKWQDHQNRTNEKSA